MVCKKRLVDVLVDFIEPIRQRRLVYEQDIAQVMQILKIGTEKARAVSQSTLNAVKTAMKQNYFG